jgi:AsmA protein
MRKILKYSVIALAALLGLLLAGAGILAATFNPNDYKPLLIRLVQEKKQRTLTIPGQIKLSFFPRLGADLGQVSLSEHKGSAEFAAVDSAKVSLALLPLLSRQLVVDHIRIDGMRANIKRYKGGSSNFDDLLSSDESGQQVKFDIDSVRLTRAHLVFDDQQQARRLKLAQLDLETGKIANGVPSKLQLAADIRSNKPDVNAKLALKSGFLIDLDQKHYALKGLDAELKGGLSGLTDLVLKASGDADLKPATKRFVLDGIKLSANGKRAREAIDVKFDIPRLVITDAQVSGGKLSGEATLMEGTRTVKAAFSVPSFDGSPQAFKLPALALDASIKDGKLEAKARVSGALAGDIDRLLFSSPQLALSLSGKKDGSAINGALSTPLSVNLQTQLIELSRLAADFTLPNPAGGILNFKAGGSARIHLGKQTASAELNGSLDQSRFNAKLGLSDFSPMAYTFDIGIDQIDLARYQSRQAPAKAAGAEQTLDLSFLQNLQASGSARIGALKVANIKTSNLRFALRAGRGKLDISPLSANLYGGSAAGALSVAAGNPARFALKQTLAGIDVGPLLKDALDKEPIEGKGMVQLDVTASGATFSRIRKSLNGTARLEVRNGAVRGVNIAQMMRNAKTKLDALRGTGGSEAQSGTGSAAEKTDFSELNGSFRISNGVAHNDDLNIKSPLIRVGGAGDINLGDERLDYLVKATVVSTLQGQGGPELQALKGVTVPVRLSGPFAAIGWRIDVAGMASELARQKIDEKKEEVTSKAQKALDEEKAKIRDQLKGQLKGLLGK